MLQYIEKKREEWANWYSRGDGYGLNYSSCSILYRLMKEGHIIRSSGPKPLPTHEAAQEIKSLVKIIAQQNQKIALSLHCQYFTQGFLQQKPKQLNFSHIPFKCYVDMAHQWLAGRLIINLTL